ncbi:MAG TPA: 30S ribosomal protein S9 [Saprospiraceae bacterium]|nr:30S ribosomal protein S9 [Saprospiraceae bacterium]
MEIINATGRRKSSVSRVYLRQGSGKITINGKDYKDYLPQVHIHEVIVEPLQLADVKNIYDIDVNVYGGGFRGQAEATRLAIARALVKIDEDFRALMKPRKLLTRDARVVERKKFGKPKARKSFQFSKR